MLRREPTRIALCASDRDELDEHLRLRAAAAPEKATPLSASTPATPSPQPDNTLRQLLDPPPPPSKFKTQRFGLSTPRPGPTN
ncbi:unnamed protein product [Urochloa decumbens]|uniref:Uncharacterized protein n=1 Tax=Urochloa decumbens TaxID=240449 RepID=A0ABC8ZPL4_9POAL